MSHSFMTIMTLDVPNNFVLIDIEQSSSCLSMPLSLNLEKTRLATMVKDTHLNWGTFTEDQEQEWAVENYVDIFVH